jgi:hypothetical protein
MNLKHDWKLLFSRASTLPVIIISLGAAFWVWKIYILEAILPSIINIYIKFLFLPMLLASFVGLSLYFWKALLIKTKLLTKDQAKDYPH